MPRYVKGQSGNPHGAPKRDWTWSGVLENAVEEMRKDGRPVKVHIAEALLREALKGNVNAQKELMNRMDGMPIQQTDLTSKGEQLKQLVVLDTKK